MDELMLAVLRAEVAEDCRVLVDTARLARERFGSGSESEMEASSYHLSRMYNVIEQLGLRIAKAFENNIDDDQGWHMELLRRLSIAIPGIRPPLFTADILPDLQELRGFRHVVRHAYDLILKKDKLAALLEVAERLALRLPAACNSFFKAV